MIGTVRVALAVGAALGGATIGIACSSAGAGGGHGGTSAAGMAMPSAASSGTGGAGGSPVQPPACPPTPATGDFPCDVGAVVTARCQPCHQNPTLHGAHFPLLTYEDTQQPFGLAPTDGGAPFLRWMRMYEVIQPGFLPHMPSTVFPACDGGFCSLDDAEYKTLNDWFLACVPSKPEGTGCDVGEGPADAGGG